MIRLSNVPNVTAKGIRATIAIIPRRTSHIQDTDQSILAGRTRTSRRVRACGVCTGGAEEVRMYTKRSRRITQSESTEVQPRTNTTTLVMSVALSRACGERRESFSTLSIAVIVVVYSPDLLVRRPLDPVAHGASGMARLPW